jgi:hypothetical protein
MPCWHARATPAPIERRRHRRCGVSRHAWGPAGGHERKWRRGVASRVFPGEIDAAPSQVTWLLVLVTLLRCLFQLGVTSMPPRGIQQARSTALANPRIGSR